MKTLVLILIFAGPGLNRLVLSQTGELKSKEFAEAVKCGENNILIDLRSDSDFRKGHISGATNIDYEWPTYEWRITDLDTSQNVFIYCQNGIRSEKTVTYLKSKGFTSVTILNGGLEKWLLAGYTLTPEELMPPSELTFNDFSQMLDLEHLVLVCFYLPGDINCRKIEPVLDELALTYSGKLKILRIDIDTYKYLATELGIEFVPTLQFYENGNLCATIKGVYRKERIDEDLQLKENCTLTYHQTKP